MCVILSSKISIIVIPFLLISFLTAMGQTQMPITVSTDKPSYHEGDTMSITGKVLDQLNIPISVIIKDNTQQPVYLSQTNVNPDNTYSIQAIAGGDLWKTTGTYEIDVTYGGKDRTAQATFEFSGKEQPISPVNQTNVTKAIPEFGYLSGMIFALSTLVIVIFYAKTRTSLKFRN